MEDENTIKNTLKRNIFKEKIGFFSEASEPDHTKIQWVLIFLFACDGNIKST